MLFVFIALQFFDRIKLFGMPAKHQPDLIYLRYVPLWKVHIFTIVQLTCLVLLWVIKATAAAVVFPMMVNIKSHPLIGTFYSLHLALTCNLATKGIYTLIPLHLRFDWIMLCHTKFKKAHRLKKCRSVLKKRYYGFT